MPLGGQEPGEKLAKGPRKGAGSSDGSSVQQLQRVLELLGTSSVVRLSMSFVIALRVEAKFSAGQPCIICM